MVPDESDDQDRPLLHFAPFSSADFVCPFLCQSAVASVAVHSTPLATTEQHARQQGSWGGEGGLLSRLRQEFAEKEEPVQPVRRKAVGGGGRWPPLVWRSAACN